MQIYLSRPDITEKEIEAVCDVLRDLLSQEHVADSGRAIPDLLPSHLLKIFSMQFKLDPLPKSCAIDVFLIGIAGYAYGLRNLKAVLGQ